MIFSLRDLLISTSKWWILLRASIINKNNNISKMLVSEISQNLISTHEVLNFLADWLVAFEAGWGVGAAALAGEHVVAGTVEDAA